MYKNVLEYLEKTAAGAAADRGVSDVDTFMSYPAFVEMARNAGAALTGLVPAGRPVAVFAEKGVRTLAAMIGVVYSGGFYVSINPEQPAERIARTKFLKLYSFMKFMTPVLSLSKLSASISSVYVRVSKSRPDNRLTN